MIPTSHTSFLPWPFLLKRWQKQQWVFVRFWQHKLLEWNAVFVAFITAAANYRELHHWLMLTGPILATHAARMAYTVCRLHNGCRQLSRTLSLTCAYRTNFGSFFTLHFVSIGCRSKTVRLRCCSTFLTESHFLLTQLSHKYLAERVLTLGTFINT